MTDSLSQYDPAVLDMSVQNQDVSQVSCIGPTLTTDHQQFCESYANTLQNKVNTTSENNNISEILLSDDDSQPLDSATSTVSTSFSLLLKYSEVSQ